MSVRVVISSPRSLDCETRAGGFRGEAGELVAQDSVVLVVINMHNESPYELTQLIRAIAEPASGHGVDRDVLTDLLGLEQDPNDLVKMKQYARRRVQSEFLQPVKDLEDEYIGHWQMQVFPCPGSSSWFTDPSKGSTP